MSIQPTKDQGEQDTPPTQEEVLRRFDRLPEREQEAIVKIALEWYVAHVLLPEKPASDALTGN